VWHAITDFLLKAHASGLGHDAVIEIMIALLGVMMAVMAILSALVTLLFAALGFFGYKSIEERSINAAEKKAEEIALKTFAESRATEQGAALGFNQPAASKKKGPKPVGSRSSKKTSDSSLISGEQNDTQ
jgi:hypothetical protein